MDAKPDPWPHDPAILLLKCIIAGKLETPMGAYVQTYLERDVRSLRQVANLSQYQAFLRALAARSAPLVNLGRNRVTRCRKQV